MRSPMKFYNPKTGKLTSEKPVPVTQRIVTYNPLHEPESYIEWADVERVGMAIRSARGGNTQPLFALYRDIILSDSHIQAELAKRKIAILGDTMRIIPYDKKNPADRDAAAFCEQQIYELKSWRTSMSALMDGVLWPVAVCEKTFVAEGQGYRIADLPQVPAHLLDFSSGKLQIRHTDQDGAITENSIDPDPERFVIHRGHLLTSPDHFGGPMRSLLYWWLCGSMSRDWWVRFLERHGSPFIVGKFAPGNDNDRRIILGAMDQATRSFGIAVSTTTEIQLIEASKAGADAYAAFMAVAQREKSKLILGQTLSAQTDPTGLGSGVADLQSDVREDIRKHDALMLSETLRDQLLAQLCRINRLPGRPPYIMWGKATKGEIQATANALTSLRQAGYIAAESAMEPLSEELGFEIERAPPDLGPPLAPFPR
jgi:phage gp29-like protein